MTSVSTMRGVRRALKLACLTGLALLAACSRPAAPQAAGGGAAVTLTYASPYPPNHPFSQADIAWIKYVEGRAHGRLKIRPFWGGSLVSSDNAMLELNHGVADIALITPIYSRAGVSAIKIQAGFYSGANSPADQVAVYKCLQKSFPVFDEELPGLKVLAIQGGNLPQILTRDRPIRTVEDLRGLRLRTPSEAAPLLRQLGADPVTMPMGEVYSALSKGVIDGVLAPSDTLKSLHFNEVARHMSTFAVPRGAYPARAISLRAWGRLPPDIQSILSSSQDYWEAQLNERVTRAAVTGLAFGKSHGEMIITPTDAEQARFLALYDQVSLREAMSRSSKGFSGADIFRAAHLAITQYKAHGQGC